MIAKLSGIIDSIGEGWAIIDVSGVGYMVFCSGRTLGQLNANDAASLAIETHVREDHIHLYGFMETRERDWFKLLTTVQGVGAKVALAILTVLGTDELANAIAAGDRSAVSRAAGVGPKLAARIVSELKDKSVTIALAPHTTSAGTNEGGDTAAMSDALSALVNLGYNASQAHSALAVAANKLDGAPGVEELIRAGLCEMGSSK